MDKCNDMQCEHTVQNKIKGTEGLVYYIAITWF